MSRKILVASYTSRVATLSFDTATSPPSLSIVSSLEVGHHPSWITPHETDKTVVFAAVEQADGMVKALKFDLTSGRGIVVAEVTSSGADPCHLAISGMDLIAANYSGGNICVLPLSSSVPYLPSQPSQVISFSGTGPILSRQEASHPHQALVHPARQELIIPDLGTDKLWRLEKENNKWVVVNHIDVQPGGGPRHGVIVGETLYTLMELSNMLTSHRLPPQPGKPVALDMVPTLLNPPQNPTAIDQPPLAAEIVCPPVSAEYPTQYLYVTNRNDKSPEGDVLAIFEIGKAGTPQLIKEIRTGLNHLRGIAFDEQNRYLIAGGSLGGGVKLYERVNGGKDMKELAHLPDVEKPTGFHWLSAA